MEGTREGRGPGGKIGMDCNNDEVKLGDDSCGEVIFGIETWDIIVAREAFCGASI